MDEILLKDSEIVFEDLKIDNQTLRALNELGFEKTTEVQGKVIPYIIEGSDILVQAQTGSGKTAAFGIPIASMVETDENCVQALVITPTRELSIQTAKDIKNISKYKRIRELAIYGGQPIEQQLRQLKQRVHVVVGTPGRVLDHIKRGTLDLSGVKLIVIDEADRMFDMGFIEEAKKILESIPHDRQTLMFSATISEETKLFAEKYAQNPININTIQDNITVDTVKQYYFVLNENAKFKGLINIIEFEGLNLIGRTMIFCKTKKTVADLAKDLKAEGYDALSMHGEMEQKQRIEVIEKFKEGTLKFLICTDVAARGLNVDSVTHVINYDIPDLPENYVHRVGRTARAGASGTAFTFAASYEIEKLRKIEAYIKSKIIKSEVPKKDQKRELGDIELEELKNEEKTNIVKKKDTDGITRLHINLGKKDKVRAGDIVGAIAKNVDISADVIGVIDTYDYYSFIEVFTEYADKIISGMKDKKIKGKNVKIQKKSN
jgi:ATP-dependent RNA helicase DeaD